MSGISHPPNRRQPEHPGLLTSNAPNIGAAPLARPIKNVRRRQKKVDVLLQPAAPIAPSGPSVATGAPQVTTAGAIETPSKTNAALIRSLALKSAFNPVTRKRKAAEVADSQVSKKQETDAAAILFQLATSWLPEPSTGYQFHQPTGQYAFANAAPTLQFSDMNTSIVHGTTAPNFQWPVDTTDFGTMYAPQMVPQPWMDASLNANNIMGTQAGTFQIHHATTLMSTNPNPPGQTGGLVQNFNLPEIRVNAPAYENQVGVYAGSQMDDPASLIPGGQARAQLSFQPSYDMPAIGYDAQEYHLSAQYQAPTQNLPYLIDDPALPMPATHLIPASNVLGTGHSNHPAPQAMLGTLGAFAPSSDEVSVLPTAEEIASQLATPKIKFTGNEAQQVGLPDGVSLAHYYSLKFNTYVGTNSLGQGANGKFRRAIDQNGRMWGIKEFRSEDAKKKTGFNKKGKTRTFVAKKIDIEKELKLIRDASPNFEIHDVIVHKGKYFIVMTLMEDEVHNAFKRLRAGNGKNAINRSAFAQLSKELVTMHAKGIIHGDIKGENALWDGDGRVILSDFGAALRRQEDGKYESGLRSTFPSPEMAESKSLTEKTDTWSLGVQTIASLVTHASNPFFWMENKKEMVANFKDFAEWREGVKDKHGAIKVSKITGNTKWDKFFREAADQDPYLVQFVIQRLLHPIETKRADMVEVAQQASHFYPKDTANLAKDTFSILGQLDPKRVKINEGLKTYYNKFRSMF